LKKRSRRAVPRAVDRGQSSTAKAADKRAGQTAQPPGNGRAWQRVLQVFAVLDAVGTLTGLVVVGNGLVNHFVTSSESYKRDQEERLVARLAPGQDWLRIVQLIGSSPDYHRRLPSGNTLYQYQRPWENLQVVVDPDGRVLSVGVYAISTDFHPTLRLGDSPGYPVTLNRSPVVFPEERPTAANGYCGAHKAGYFEAYYPMANAYGGRNLVSGVSDATTTAVDVGDACKIADICGSLPQDNQGRRPVRRLRARLTGGAAAAVASDRKRAHHHGSRAGRTDDMLWPPDEDVGSP
jgi:hypothetical protein